jgi:hypothetical protein
MSHFHTVIAVERRTGDRANSTAMSKMIPDGIDAEGKPKYRQGPVQLHSMGSALTNKDDANILMACEWDGIAPYVITHKGVYADVTMRYMGWPELDKETYDALYPSNPL